MLAVELACSSPSPERTHLDGGFPQELRACTACSQLFRKRSGPVCEGCVCKGLKQCSGNAAARQARDKRSEICPNKHTMSELGAAAVAHAYPVHCLLFCFILGLSSRRVYSIKFDPEYLDKP